MKRAMNLLPQVSFSIMMALSLKPRHGYEIMKQVSDDSEGRVHLGPGALYSSIKLLRKEGYIEELDGEDGSDSRRRYYKLTQLGWNRLNDELEYFKNTLKLSKHRTMKPVNE